MNDLQARISAIKSECEKVIELDRLATARPWAVSSGEFLSVWISSKMSTVASIPTDSNFCAPATSENARFIAHSCNISPAMARVVLMAIDDGIAQGDSCFLEIIADRWEGK